MSKTTPQKTGDSGETALQLIKESLDEELNLVAHVFVVLGASVCHNQSVNQSIIYVKPRLNKSSQEAPL